MTSKAADHPAVAFEVSRDALKGALDFLGPTLRSTKKLSALGQVHIETSRRPSNEGKIRITANNLEQTVTHELPARVTAPGTLVLNGTKTAEVVSGLPAGRQIAFSVEAGGGRAHVVSEKSHYQLNCGDPDSFPESPQLADSARSVLVSGERLRTMIERTAYAITKEESRYALSGAELTVGRNKDRMVTTDGHRLAFVETNGLNRLNHQDVTTLVPTQALDDIARLLKGCKSDVRLTVGENHIRVEHGARTLTSRLLTGQFPSWQAVLDNTLKEHARRGADQGALILVEALAQAARRVDTMTNDRTHDALLRFDDNTLTISARTAEEGEASDVVDIEYQSEAAEVKLNLEYLLEAVSPFNPTDVVEVKVLDSVTAIIIRPIGESGMDTKAVVMPMKF
jgi:DNA polymerase III subunit beta